jgi:hypothetical protein
MKKLKKITLHEKSFLVIEDGLSAKQLSKLEQNVVRGGGYCGTDGCGTDGCPANSCAGGHLCIDDLVCSFHMLCPTFCIIDLYCGDTDSFYTGYFY